MNDRRISPASMRSNIKRDAKFVIDVLRVSNEGRTNAGGRSMWQACVQVLELLAKLLPGIALVAAIFAFHDEIADFLRRASSVEAFGFKMQRETFATRLKEQSKALPSLPQNEEFAEAAFRKLKLAAPAMIGLRILWVDDHPENNFYLRRILTDIGAQITIAMNNAEGLNYVRRADFDVIISDFNRDPPLQENGGQLANLLARMQYPTRIVFYTGDPSKVPETVTKIIATNDPAQLLGMIAELAIAKR